ncbi:hypothetical protein VP01_7044g1 [Puccinia sorghi]|uniref:Retrotransposon gag domain-containing protein n=1 Tax=Puccinia sorghi TaxID=27349 RepID=A0A0L6UDN8_9BASI|nr:hypothetical protein VP01_7044g1 [Puccinia sorghi]
MISRRSSTSQWFKLYLDLLENQSPSFLTKNCDQFEQQLFILFGDPNAVQNAEFKLKSLSMKENGKGQLELCHLCFPFSKRASESHHRPAFSHCSMTQNASTFDQSNHPTQTFFCLINSWDRFKQQFFTLFGDPNEASTCIAQFQTLQSRIDWNDANFAFHFRKGLLSCITDQLALTGQRLKTLQKWIN